MIGSSGRRLLAGLAYAVVILAPMAWILRQAIGGSAGGEVAEIWQRSDVQGLLGNSILLALTVTLLALPLGLPLALLLNLRRFPGRRMIGVLYFLPLVIPPHIHTIAWMRVIGDVGWFKHWAEDTLGWTMNIRASLVDAQTGGFFSHIFMGPAWIMACSYFPLLTLSVSAGVRALDPEALDAARILGGRGCTLRKVVLPLLGPRILAGSFFVFVLSLATYPVVSLLDTPVLIGKIFFTFQKVNQEAGALMALPLVAVAGVAVLVLGVAEKRGTQRQTGLGAPRLERGGFLTTLAALTPLVLAAGVPLGSLLWVAGPLSFSGGVTDNYQSVFDRVTTAFGDSLTFSGLGVVALLVLSYPLGRYLAWRRARGVETLSLACLAFPPVVIGVALVLFWSHAATHTVGPVFLLVCALALAVWAAEWGRSPPRATLIALGSVAALAAVTGLIVLVGLPSAVYGSGALLVLAYLARFMPFTVRLFRNGFRALDPEEVEAARLCGHGILRRMASIELPRMKGVVGGAAVTAWVLCFTELAATLMVIPEGRQSVQIRIFNMIHYRAIGEVAALCVLSILVAALPVVLYAVLGSKRMEVL